MPLSVVVWKQDLAIFDTRGREEVIDLPAHGTDVRDVFAQHSRLAECGWYASQHVVAQSIIGTVPTEYPSVPLPAPFAADRPVEAYVGRKISAVGCCPSTPGIDVLEAHLLYFAS